MLFTTLLSTTSITHWLPLTWLFGKASYFQKDPDSLFSSFLTVLSEVWKTFISPKHLSQLCDKSTSSDSKAQREILEKGNLILVAGQSEPLGLEHILGKITVQVQHISFPNCLYIGRIVYNLCIQFAHLLEEVSSCSGSFRILLRLVSMRAGGDVKAGHAQERTRNADYVYLPIQINHDSH